MSKELRSSGLERPAAYSVEPHELDVSFTLDVYPDELEPEPAAEAASVPCSKAKKTRVAAA